ncbi:MAG: hypothetical protein ACXVUE_08425 [Solirubrobacteraceae bacterium]
MREIVPGLWRWTAPHSAWAPGAEPESTGDWDELVGCVLYECADSVVFIDPLIPTDAASFWRWADRRVARRPRVHVLTTLTPHRRSREEITRRYGAIDCQRSARWSRATDFWETRRAGCGFAPSPGCIG